MENVLDPKIGDEVIYWTLGEKKGDVLHFHGNPALIVGVRVRGPRGESMQGPRIEDSPNGHDVMLFVMFGPYTGLGGGCGNRYVRAEDWGHIQEGGVTWPDDEPDFIGGVPCE